MLWWNSIVKEVINYNGQSMEELRAPRDKEEDCYNFILSDLDEAIRLLPETNQIGRVNKYVGYGLKAKSCSVGCFNLKIW